MNNLRLPLLAVLIVLAADFLRAAQAPSAWPGWRGPNRDGKSSDTGLLKAWPPEGPALAWKAVGLGQGFSSVSVSGNSIYTSGIRDGRLTLIALDLNGTRRWSTEVDAKVINNYPGSRSTPTVDGANVYLESDQGKVACFDAATGKEKWARHMSEFGGRPPGWGFSESVLVVDDWVVVTPGGTNCLVALDKRTGATVWGSPSFAGAHYSSPILVRHGGVSMIVNGTQGGLIAVDAKTGRKLWTHAFSAGNTANCPTPAFADGRVFWATGYGKGGICLKLDVANGQVTATESWQTKDMDCHHGGYVIQGGLIYGNHKGGWTCLLLETGEKQWQAPGVGKGSICYADDMLYLFSEGGGRIGLAPATPEGLTLTGDFQVQGKAQSWAHPVVTGGRLYLRYEDNLYAYDVRAESAAAPKPAPRP